MFEPERHELVQSRQIMIGDILRDVNEGIEYISFLYELHNPFRYEIELENIEIMSQDTKQEERRSNQVFLMSGTGSPLPSDCMCRVDCSGCNPYLDDLILYNRKISEGVRPSEDLVDRVTKCYNSLNYSILYRDIRKDFILQPQKFHLKYHQKLLQLSIQSSGTCSDVTFYFAKPGFTISLSRACLVSEFLSTIYHCPHKLLKGPNNPRKHIEAFFTTSRYQDLFSNDRVLMKYGVVEFYKRWYDLFIKKKIRRCYECGNQDKESKKRRCGSCRTRFFCDQKCQKKNWRRVHKEECMKLRRKTDQLVRCDVINAFIPTILPYLDQLGDVLSCCRVFKGLWRAVVDFFSNCHEDIEYLQGYMLHCSFSIRKTPLAKKFHVSVLTCNLPLPEYYDRISGKFVRPKDEHLVMHEKKEDDKTRNVYHVKSKIFEIFPFLKKLEIILDIFVTQDKLGNDYEFYLGTDFIQHKHLASLSIRFGDIHDIVECYESDYVDDSCPKRGQDSLRMDISCFPNLQKLQIQRTWYPDPGNYGILTVKDTRNERPSLTKLKLEGWVMKDREETVFSPFFQPDQLVKLILSNNNLSSSTNETSFKRICGLMKLELLVLEGNSICQLEVLENLPELRELIMRNEVDFEEYKKQGYNEDEFCFIELNLNPVILQIKEIKNFGKLRSVVIGSEGGLDVVGNEEKVLTFSNNPNLEEITISRLKANIRMDHTPSLKSIRCSQIYDTKNRSEPNTIDYLTLPGQEDSCNLEFINIYGYQIHTNFVRNLQHQTNLRSLCYDRYYKYIRSDLSEDNYFFRGDSGKGCWDGPFQPKLVGMENLSTLRLRSCHFFIKEISQCPRLTEIEWFPAHRNVVLRDLPNIRKMRFRMFELGAGSSVAKCSQALKNLRELEIEYNVDEPYLMLGELGSQVQKVTVFGCIHITVFGDGKTNIKELILVNPSHAMVFGHPKLKSLLYRDRIPRAGFYYPEPEEKTLVIMGCPEISAYPDFATFRNYER